MSTNAGGREQLQLIEVHALAERVLSANGCDAATATAVAANMTAAERDGCASHGLFRLGGHVAALRSGKANGSPTPTLHQPAPSILDMDGDRAFAPRCHVDAIPALIEAAEQTGIAVLAIRRTLHFAALWPEAEAIAETGLVSMAFVSSIPFVAPAGGTDKFFGTNPMAFGWPRGDSQPPMVFDQASSVMARGEIKIAARDGHPIPDGVGIDVAGEPTNNPAAILEGAQLPFGSYKGSAIALMVDLLAGPLFGEVSSWQAGIEDNGDGGPSLGGQLLVALDPSWFGDGGAADPVAAGEQVFGEMLGQPGVRLPGDRRHAQRIQSERDGVAIPASLLDELEDLAKENA